ncbi:polyprenyl synthetase family protein [Brachybacterium sp. J144]|uniref:polyprenyl synthetase family protein n=1 Tax=Brachybacterium sp. J144 TaxID=3116487 RepID=UPI002E767B4C|nr:polyprenyl synthetase family protein [Brachybacterium sp. J144]MEE1651310.1 polyprenyl synthetase family protein [Brachybacterium sp. J144]
MPVSPEDLSAAQLAALDAGLVDAVGAVLDAELAARRALLEPIAPEAVQLIDHLETYLEGGKLLRPRFVFWGGVAALDREPDPQEVDSLARAGAAIELVQAAALLHDDVIDHSPLRRGRPAAHVAAAARHRELELDGSDEEFGVAAAIILGDLALSWSEQLAATLRGEPAALSAGRAEFDALRTEVMTGQYLDILHQAGGFASAPDAVDAALAVIRWKTVPYTVLRPVRTGAALMGAPDAVLSALSDWAVEIGTAFQLRDDLLSVVGAQDATGKPIGGDIVEGKRTVLLARTEQAADDAGRTLLDEVVGRAGASAPQIEQVHELMVRTGAVAAVAQDVRDGALRGRRILERTPGLGALGVAGLQRIADHATDVETLTA